MDENRQRPAEELYRKPRFLAYALARFIGFILSHFVFHRRVLRNELKGAKGPCLIIANHQCAMDFANLIGLCRRRMTVVFSRSFFSTLPFPGFARRLGVIAKQQFQTEIRDIRKMKAVVENGAPLVIYPAGLMCEDGQSTPIPDGTWSLFRLLDVDVYMARTTGAYFVMPKWGKGLRPGKTYMDVYRLFTRQELHTLSKEEIHRRASEALTFDAYAEQEKHRVAFQNGDCVEGLENVLYQCPRCGKKYSIRARKRRTLICTECNFTETSDEKGFLHNEEESSEIRHVSEWNRRILRNRAGELDGAFRWSLPCRIHMVDEKLHRFTERGKGTVTITDRSVEMEAVLDGEAKTVVHSVADFPTLPFGPGKYFEIQNRREIYRCYPVEGKYVMEFINTLKILHGRAKARTIKAQS